MQKLKRLSVSLGLSFMIGLSSQAFSETAQLGFDTQPNYIPGNVISLTFDDGVDAVNTLGFGLLVRAAVDRRCVIPR